MLTLVVSDAAYRLWESGKDRFAVTQGRQVLPVLGYVSQNLDESWKIERAGKIFRVSYPSAADAARALIEFGKPKHGMRCRQTETRMQRRPIRSC
jgi:hypothetical protein